ncbi:MAG: WD40/YVTN/BNR-like repeat-containing protein [Candidatus Binataceae bacterium]
MLALACALMIVVGAPSARATIEGPKTTGAPPWMHLFSAAIRPDGAIFVVGAKAALLTSTDKGQTWTRQTLHERDGNDLFQDRDLYSIRFAPDGKTALIVGELGTILRSTDGGETWKAVDSGTTKNLMKVCLVDAQNAVAVGSDGIIVRTTDGGEHWQTEKCPKLLTLFDVTFTDKNTGWIAGEFSTVLNSTDGGQTWNIVTGGNIEDFTIGPFFSIAFSDPQHAIAAGLSGELSTSDDGGKTWKKAALPADIGTYALAITADGKKTWALGTGGRIFTQTSGGPWQEGQRNTFNDLTDIALDGNEGVIVGSSGTILLTDDAGEKWQAAQ